MIRHWRNWNRTSWTSQDYCPWWIPTSATAPAEHSNTQLTSGTGLRSFSAGNRVDPRPALGRTFLAAGLSVFLGFRSCAAHVSRRSRTAHPVMDHHPVVEHQLLMPPDPVSQAGPPSAGT